MIDPRRYTEYKTVNNNTSIFVLYDSISHIISHQDPVANVNGETCWIHFHNGKCTHVVDSYEVVMDDLTHYLDSL